MVRLEFVGESLFQLPLQCLQECAGRGTVSVELDVKPYSELTFFLPAKLNKYKNTEIRYLTISIQDNGVGIAPDELEKIFQPFYQVAQNEHSKSGTGIGLSLSKAIIEMHHGVVWAENATGANMSGVGLSSSGAVFKFVLPVDKSLFAPEMIIESLEDKAVSFSVELPDAAYEPDNSSRKQATILVVEDNRDLNNYICSCLADRYNVVGVTNGEDALAKAVYLLPQPDYHRPDDAQDEWYRTDPSVEEGYEYQPYPDYYGDGKDWHGRYQRRLCSRC